MARSPGLLDLVRTALAELMLWPALAELVLFFYFVALVLIVLAVAIPIFLVTGLGLVVLTTALGATGTLAAVLSLAWLAIFLGGTAVAVARIVRLLRPMTRKVESVAEAGSTEGGKSASLQYLPSPDQTRASLPTGATGDPLSADEGSDTSEPNHPRTESPPNSGGSEDQQPATHGDGNADSLGWPTRDPGGRGVVGSNSMGGESWVCSNCGSINLSSGTRCYRCRQSRRAESVEPADQRSNEVDATKANDPPTTMHWVPQEPPSPWLTLLVYVIAGLAIFGLVALVIIGLSP